MTTPKGSDSVIRVAIIGSGPSGFYAADYLLKQSRPRIAVDMFERLPTPFGLVRGGVAPDHEKIKSVTKLYSRIAQHERFRLFGNVEFGRDITRAALSQHYHGIFYAVGAQSDRKLGIPGESLPNSFAATEFVGWYNGHPDYQHCHFDLRGVKRVVVVGVGNVAVDVARILARTPDELYETDIADYALATLAQSEVEEIVMLGRRGPAQAAFSNAELQELGKMADADIILSSADAALDALSAAQLQESGDRATRRKVDILQGYARRGGTGKSRRLILRFLLSPIAIVGEQKVEALILAKNELYLDGRGNLRPQPTGEQEQLPADMVFRSVGYHGVALPDLPFYERWGIIPNAGGRVLQAHDSDQRLRGNYVVGWIKRGPTGIIGTNKPDANETVQCFLEDLVAGQALQPQSTRADAIPTLLQRQQPNYCTFEDWQRLDEIEVQRGAALGRSRLKFTTVEAMLKALGKSSKEPTDARS